MLLGIERAGARHLDDVAAPFAFGAVELDVGAAAAGALPRRERQVLHLADADVAEHRDAFRLHEVVVGRLRPAELAEAGALAAGRLVPVRLAGNVMHGPSPRRRSTCRRLVALLRSVGLVHLRRQPVLGELLRELLARLRVLVGVVDLVAAVPLADPGLRHALRVADRDALVLEGEIARRRRAGVEVLMQPHVRRHDHGADLPLVVARLVALRPHQRIAFAGEDDDMRARSVRVRLLVGADRELRDVAVERALGEVEADVAAAGAALLRRDQRQVDRVGHEVGGEQEALGLVLGGEIIRLAVEAALEVVAWCRR